MLACAALGVAGCGDDSDRADTNADEQQTTERESTTPGPHRRRHKRNATTSTAIPPGARPATVARIVDGDTIDLTNGRAVRLVQIDTPETTEGECYAARARGRLAALVPPGTRIGLRADPALDDTDRYDRLLRYVYRGRHNVNLALVRRGAATVWFYQGERGRFAETLVRATRRARAAGRGLWGACPGTPLDTGQGAATGGGSSDRRGGAANGAPNPGDRDRDCSDFSSRAEAQRFFESHGGPRRDPHRLDSDGDGRVCESL